MWLLKDYLWQVEINRNKSAEARELLAEQQRIESEAKDKIRQAIQEGQTTGDSIRDFLLMQGILESDTPVEKMLRTLEERLQGKIGQFVMVVHRWQEPFVKVSHPSPDDGLFSHKVTRTESQIGVLQGSDRLMFSREEPVMYLPTGDQYVPVPEVESNDNLTLVRQNLGVRLTPELMHGRASLLEDGSDVRVYVGDEEVITNLLARRPLNRQDALRARPVSTLRRIACSLGRPTEGPGGLQEQDRAEVAQILRQQEEQLEHCLVQLLSINKSRPLDVPAVREAAYLLEHTWDYCRELDVEFADTGHRFGWIAKVDGIDSFTS